MNMISVQSSDISAVGYDGGTLYIRFHDGSVYQYPNVPESVYQGLVNATSHGRYFHAYIRRQYRGIRLS